MEVTQPAQKAIALAREEKAPWTLAKPVKQVFAGDARGSKPETALFVTAAE